MNERFAQVTNPKTMLTIDPFYFIIEYETNFDGINQIIDRFDTLVKNSNNCLTSAQCDTKIVSRYLKHALQVYLASNLKAFHIMLGVDSWDESILEIESEVFKVPTFVHQAFREFGRPVVQNDTYYIPKIRPYEEKRMNEIMPTCDRADVIYALEKLERKEKLVPLKHEQTIPDSLPLYNPRGNGWFSIVGDQPRLKSEALERLRYGRFDEIYARDIANGEMPKSWRS